VGQRLYNVAMRPVSCTIALAALFCSAPALAQDEKQVDLKKQVIQAGKAELMAEPLDPLSFAPLSTKALRIVRNTIYARRGYIFKAKDLTSHFNKFPWYAPDAAVTEKLKRGEGFTEQEKRTLQIIRNLEKLRKGKGRNLVAGKHFNCGAASEDVDYSFCTDGTAEYRDSSGDPTVGTWKLEGSVIVIRWTRRRESKGVGKVMAVAAAGPSYERYVHREVTMNENEELDWLETQRRDGSDCGHWTQRDFYEGEGCGWD
jgi:hypothetical protein